VTHLVTITGTSPENFINNWWI